MFFFPRFQCSARREGVTIRSRSSIVLAFVPLRVKTPFKAPKVRLRRQDEAHNESSIAYECDDVLDISYLAKATG